MSLIEHFFGKEHSHETKPHHPPDRPVDRHDRPAGVTSADQDKKKHAKPAAKKWVKPADASLVDPWLIFSQATTLELSKEQMVQLKKIMIDARRKANALLSPEQAKKAQAIKLKKEQAAKKWKTKQADAGATKTKKKS
jgi:hypothetical protein